MSNAPLMPKATAVWLVENTSLTFDQIASFCKLHPLEVKGIADGCWKRSSSPRQPTPWTPRRRRRRWKPRPHPHRRNQQ